MKKDDYERWVGAARAQARERMAGAGQRFGLGRFARFEIDLPGTTIRFFDAADVEQIHARLQVAGSWAPAARTWLWGWENDSVPQTASALMSAVRERGECDGVEPLQGAFGECDEGEAWTMASLAADILDAESVYRAGGDTNRLFLLLFDIRKVG
ncbi:DUF6882 domain-containing protein [Roseateles sp. P5_D6]